MRIMKKPRLGFVFLLIFIGLTACATAGATTTEPPTEAAKLTPYHTATATPTVTPTPEGLSTATLSPTITPTPHIYEVYANDTMIGIANYFGITLEELQAANPAVQPAYLTVGMELVIPPAKATTEVVSVATSAPFDINLISTICARSLTGGFHCYALAQNAGSVPLENLSAEITLSDPAKGETISRQARLPLSRLAPGASLPFYVYFTPPVFENPGVTAAILSVTEANVDEGTVFPLEVETSVVSISVDGASAQVSGRAVAPEGSAVNRITLAAVAYDAAGNVVGLRQITRDQGWGDEGSLDFEMAVYSSGGVIDRVEVWAEAGN